MKLKKRRTYCTPMNVVVRIVKTDNDLFIGDNGNKYDIRGQYIYQHFYIFKDLVRYASKLEELFHNGECK